MVGPGPTRRELLTGAGRSAAVLALAGPLAACGRAGTTAPGPTRHPAAPPPTTAAPAVVGTAPTEADWAGLVDRVTGVVVRPGQAGFGAAVQLFDPRYDGRTPQAVVYCLGQDDAARTLAFARAHGLPPAVRSGGHSYGGYSTNDGLVVDVSRLARVSLSGDSVTVGAGTRLIDLYTALGAAGRLLPGGTCPTVGIAGLTLGGGHGVTSRAYGLTCDALRSVRVLTADGVTRTVDAADTTGLFWACQGGGGGNFGIVTSFTFATVAAPAVTLFTLQFPWAAAEQVLPAWQRWAPGQPDELWSNCLLLAQPDPGSTAPLLQVGGAWLGAPSALAGLVAPLVTDAGTAPTAQYSGQGSYLAQMYAEAGCRTLTQEQCHLPGQTPTGQLARTPVQARSDYLAGALPAAGVSAVVAAVASRQSSSLGQGGAAYDSYGGAINRVPAAATAFAHRSMICSVQYTASFFPGASAAQLAGNQAWLDALWASQRPYVTGQAYQNYIDPALVDWEQAYYAGNLARLEQVKARYDPDQVFRFAQGIRPAG